jgi:hypothetical protein
MAQHNPTRVSHRGIPIKKISLFFPPKNNKLVLQSCGKILLRKRLEHDRFSSKDIWRIFDFKDLVDFFHLQ